MAKRFLKKLYYPLDQSPLYKLYNKRKLASLLKLSLRELQSLINRDDNYNVFQLKAKNGKLRTIEQPKPSLSKLHYKIFQFLTCIEPPDYLHSGVRTRSYISNAKKHLGSSCMIKLDIENFYLSTTYKHVYNFFSQVMRCSVDVSGLLTKMCTFQGHIPTGSSLSQVLAFYSHFNMFNKINDFSKKDGLTMTCYVDDIAISGETIRGDSLNLVRNLISKDNIASKKEKEKVYYKNDPKLITGVVLKNSKMSVPNCHHMKIHEELKKIDIMSEYEKNSLRGKIISAAQVDKRFYKKLLLF